ncbi:MAG: YdcF family protein [Cytophagales bacterium]|nr:YdcF family protein [Cytophagales bacterium]
MHYKKAFDWLYARDIVTPCDAIIGFGHFDLKVPDTCARLYLQGYASKIIFTGGVGAGSTGLTKPEAEVFKEYVMTHFAQISTNAIIIENKSTNTGENIRFTEHILSDLHPEYHFGRGICSAILVATAYRQRRVGLTFKHLVPHVAFINSPPDTDYDAEYAMYKQHHEDLDSHIAGEINRIKDYPSRGYTAYEEVPEFG